MRRFIVISLIAGVAVVSPAAAAAPGAGAGTLGDPLFPGMGNGGYGVGHYDAALRFRASDGVVSARVAVTARSTQVLRRFNLDYRGPRPASVEVDGRPARFRATRTELVVHPRVAIRKRAGFRVVVRYAGRPPRVVDSDGSSEGWIRTDDGAVALGEPLGTTAWLPSNNDPQDKATLTTHITVPKSLSAISNGRLAKVARRGALKTFTWREGQPMATYLATIDIGRGKIQRGRAVGVPTYTLVDPRERRANRVLRHLPAVLAFEQRIFGRYPFDSAGNIVEHDAGAGYALETQTRPTYDGAPSFSTMVHEQSHQWFGDSVTLRDWPDIWLHEGFATWTEWYYAERHGGQSAAQTFRRLFSEPASKKEIWSPPPGHPGTSRNLFASSVYIRGAMTLQALRETIGAGPFFRILRTWVSTRRHGNGSIGQFIALAEETSGTQLDAFFKRWLFSPGKPPPAGRSASNRGSGGRRRLRRPRRRYPCSSAGRPSCWRPCRTAARP